MMLWFLQTIIICEVLEDDDSPLPHPSIEYRLALLELQHSSVFEGLPGRLFLTHDLTALKDRKYYKAGALIGWSLAHGGPGPQCIHPAFYQVVCVFVP